MDWTEKEKIEVKIEFLRMLLEMKLDDLKNEFLVTFFETYLSLTENEEETYRNRIKNELDEKEVEKSMEFVSSYRLKGREEARREIAKKMLSADMLTSKIMELTGLSSEEIQKLQ
ncbi:MAG: hypothetical protein KAX49_16295 [Halanaerobiales bacterium]|nr:hypothetical protein [Halanaerobiales bacterium]